MPNDTSPVAPAGVDLAAEACLLQSDLGRIIAAAVFDEQFYLKANPDVAMDGINPLRHFLIAGRFEGRKPSARFDPVAYANANPDVAALGMDPFLHYVLIGRMAETHDARWSAKALEQQAADLQGALARIGALENRLMVTEHLLGVERERVDWALGAVEGVAVQIDTYHAYRETDEYCCAYATSEPLVSVCVTTMDRADLLLDRAIASLLAQTYRNLEIVVVGDNCTDETQQRIAALGDSRVQFVNLQERGPYPRPGPDRWRVAGTNAVNHALTLCQGQFVTHLDDDDRMVPNRIECLLAAALAHRADFLWHPFWYEHRDGTWSRLGNGRLELGQVTTGSIFYHRYFARFPWDVHAYRLAEPGDWNRIRKIQLLRPRLRYVDEPLLHHHVEQAQATFVARNGERFIE